MTIKHTKECARLREKSAKFRGEWISIWPNYCASCDATGVICEYYDPSPPGVSLGSGYMTDCYPCDDCVVLGKCPRCGEQTFSESDEGPCSECGFNYDDSLPPLSECICEYEETA